MSYNVAQTSKELWAVLNENGEVVWTRGGSSSYPKLMVYSSEKKAIQALRNEWTKQAHKTDMLSVVMVYAPSQTHIGNTEE